MSESEPFRNGGWEREARVALACARNAGTYLRAQFGRPAKKHYRGDHDVQLAADVEAQRRIVETLTKEFPGHGVLAEEGPAGEWPTPSSYG